MIGRTQFPRSGGTWDVNRAFWRLLRAKGDTLEGRLAAVEQELELRDLQARYYDALDRGDLEAIMALFHDDCVHVGARGTFAGKDAIRQDYEYSFAQSKVRVHYAANVAVRLLSAHEAWVTSHNYALVVRRTDQLAIAAATVAQRLTKPGDEWLIIESRATHLVDHVLTREP